MQINKKDKVVVSLDNRILNFAEVKADLLDTEHLSEQVIASHCIWQTRFSSLTLNLMWRDRKLWENSYIRWDPPILSGPHVFSSAPFQSRCTAFKISNMLHALQCITILDSDLCSSAFWSFLILKPFKQKLKLNKQQGLWSKLLGFAVVTNQTENNSRYDGFEIWGKPAHIFESYNPYNKTC